MVALCAVLAAAHFGTISAVEAGGTAWDGMMREMLPMAEQQKRQADHVESQGHFASNNQINSIPSLGSLYNQEQHKGFQIFPASADDCCDVERVAKLLI